MKYRIIAIAIAVGIFALGLVAGAAFGFVMDIILNEIK